MNKPISMLHSRKNICKNMYYSRNVYHFIHPVADPSFNDKQMPSTGETRQHGHVQVGFSLYTIIYSSVLQKILLKIETDSSFSTARFFITLFMQLMLQEVIHISIVNVQSCQKSNAFLCFLFRYRRRMFRLQNVAGQLCGQLSFLLSN